MTVPSTAWQAWICTWHFAGVAEALACRARAQRAISIVDCWQRDTGNRIGTLTATLAEEQCGLRIRHHERGALQEVWLSVPRTALGRLRKDTDHFRVSDGPTPFAMIGIHVRNGGKTATINAEGEGRTLLGMLQEEQGRTAARDTLRSALKAVACHRDVTTPHALDGARERMNVQMLGETWLNG